MSDGAIKRSGVTAVIRVKVQHNSTAYLSDAWMTTRRLPSHRQ